MNPVRSSGGQLLEGFAFKESRPLWFYRTVSVCFGLMLLCARASYGQGKINFGNSTIGIPASSNVIRIYSQVRSRLNWTNIVFEPSTNYPPPANHPISIILPGINTNLVDFMARPWSNNISVYYGSSALFNPIFSSRPPPL